MIANVAEAQELIRRCRHLRETGESEPVLRSEVLSRLRVIFGQIEDEAWVSHYSTGTEAHTLVGQAGGKTASRFIDNLVGATTIEYEADLRVTSKRNEGLHQVKEHTAGLVRGGIPESQVRGVLSDTVEWYVYDVSLAPGAKPATCTTDDIILELVDSLALDSADVSNAEHLISFLRKHLAREQSRPLRAGLLSNDLGLECSSYLHSISSLIAFLQDSREADSSIKLATDLWSQFVDFLEGESNAFRANEYVDELYLCLLARLLAANVLHGYALLSDVEELKAILDGSHFRNRYQIENMVEHDYFGWASGPGYIEILLPVARQIQGDLYAYDFASPPEEDLFGRLMTQLARKSQRKLLGQEWTPSWLAKLLAERCLDNLPAGEAPRVIDMCCGSGSILAEIIRAARSRQGLNDLASLHEVATGFDIDPLAVTFAKATWVATLTSEINSASGPIVIPIYHADSLFAVTPLSKELPLFGEGDSIEVSLDGEVIRVPNILVQPEYSRLFEHIVDWAYDEALDAKSKGNSEHLTQRVANEYLNGAAAAVGTTIPADLEEPLGTAVFALARRMAELAIAERNGIWAFILRNAYRPGLLTGQFNGLVSNPPWLAMSRMADNPYRSLLKERARVYGIQPLGQSFLHLELGTTHLLHAVDRYLSENASVACLVPGTILNGHHHEPFRRQRFLEGPRPVRLHLREVWQVAPGTFKYPGAAIIGQRKEITPSHQLPAIAGFVASMAGLEEVEFTERSIGVTRSAWVLERQGTPAATYFTTKMPQQGADLMPRTAVCIEVLDDRGSELRVDTPGRDSQWAFTVKAAKELKGAQFPGNVARQFIYQMAQSENLLPFLLGEKCASVALPAIRHDTGEWEVLDYARIRRLGFVQTARRFRDIDDGLKLVGKGTPLHLRVDERRKLTKQSFGDGGFLVINGAGGKYICAACVALEDAQRLIIDQTLYWQVISDPYEAWYLVGMLNSDAMTQAVAPFNPKGAFGERHIHALPHRLMPPYDPVVDEHARISEIARNVADEVRNMVATDAFLQDPTRPLHLRRSKVRRQLMAMSQLKELESLCAVLLGTTTVDEDETL